MKVIQVSVFDNKGGAAKAAYRLQQGLRQAGINSSMVVAEKHSKDENCIVPLQDKIGFYERRLHYRQLSARFWRYFPSRPSGLSPFTQPSVRRNRRLINILPETDIVNLHWIAHFVDLQTFLAQCQVPLVWTLHDMNAFTGGCHTASDCQQYQKQCGSCPQLGSASSSDISSKIWITKREIYRHLAGGKLHFVTPSRWLAAEARSSTLLAHMPMTVIPNGLDITVFKPHDKIKARRQLGIPTLTKVILFSAESIFTRRKGLHFLLEAMHGMDNRQDVLLLSAGAGKIENEVLMTVKNLGHLADEHDMALAYSAADLFVIPALQDNLPNTVMEAMACGTPVVGFDAGGIGEMVRPGITGELVPVGNIRRLRQAILALLDDEPLRADMSVNCRKIALAEYSQAVQVKRYVNLYQSLLNPETSF